MLNNALRPLPGDACRWQTKPALSLPRPPKRAANQHRNGMALNRAQPCSSAQPDPRRFKSDLEA